MTRNSGWRPAPHPYSDAEIEAIAGWLKDGLTASQIASVFSKRLVFACAGQADTAAIARATGVPEARVTKILAGFRALRSKTPTQPERIRP